MNSCTHHQDLAWYNICSSTFADQKYRFHKLIWEYYLCFITASPRIFTINSTNLMKIFIPSYIKSLLHILKLDIQSCCYSFIIKTYFMPQMRFNHWYLTDTFIFKMQENLFIHHSILRQFTIFLQRSNVVMLNFVRVSLSTYAGFYLGYVYKTWTEIKLMELWIC